MAEGIVPFKDLAKQQLLERCRELEFVDDVQDLRCTRCNRLTLEHWYTNCGHTLCPNCKRLLSGGRCRCPHCGQFILHIENQSADFEEKVNGLRAKCPNSRYGCSLVTTVKQLQEHLVICEWTKEKALPAVYRGTNTTQVLLDEVSKLKMQIGDMHETIGFLLNELHKRQEVEEEIKKSVEMSVADIKSRLNGLSSDLHFETATLKAQTKNINFEQLQIHFSSKEEVKQQEQQLTKLDGKTTGMFQMLDEKLDKFRQRLTKDIESINTKIKASEDKIEVMRNEDKIRMEKFQQKQIVAFENYKKELLLNNKDMQEKIEKSNDDLKMELHKLSSELTLGLEQQGTSFNQKLSLEVKQLEEKILKNELKFKEESKENGGKMKTMINDLKNQEVVFMKHIQDKTKDFVSKEKLKHLQDTVAEMKVSNKLLIQIFDQKEERFSQKLTKEVEAMDTKILTSESRMEAALTKNKQETAALSKELQGKVEKSNQESKSQWQKLSSGLNKRLEQHETNINQKLSNEVKQLNEKINENKTAAEINGKENHAKMEAIKCETKKQEVDLKRQIATNVKNMQEKIQGSIVELKQQLVKVHSDMTQGLNQEQLRCNQKLTEEIKAVEEKMKRKEIEFDTKINSEFQKQEVAVEKYKKGMATFSEENKSKLKLGKQEVEQIVKGSLEKSTEEFNTQIKQLSSQMSHDIEKETKKLSQEIDQLNKKTSEIKKIIDGTTKSLQVDYKTKVEVIKQMNPQLKQTEAFQRGIAIEHLLNRKSSGQQLVDSFLFGSAQEQMVFESLCLKWTIKGKDLVIPKKGECEHVSDIFPIYGFQPKAQLKLTIHSGGNIRLHLCFLDEAREGQEVDIKPLPMLTCIIKDLSGCNRHLSRYHSSLFNKSLQYNQFGYRIRLNKSEWPALVSPGAVSLEVLVLVEPMTIIQKPLSMDGTITITIEHYSRKLQMAKEGLFDGHLSPPFLTNAGGYRVAVRMWLNGYVIKGRLGAGIYFLSCDCDSHLGMEFAHETSVTLINQWDASNNITVKQQAKEAKYYYMAIATHDAMGSGGFLVNDSLTYHMTIKPIK